MLRGRQQRRLATVMFVDIVESTRIAADVGDARWRQLVRAFRAAVRQQLRRFGGHEVDTAGDGFFAWFDQPAAALRAAAAIVADVQHLGIDVRCGVHTGELETIDGRLGGIAAHIGARVMATAGPAEVLVTNTLRELVVGGDVEFELVGETDLRGIPGRWTLHRLTTLAQQRPPLPLDPADAGSRLAPHTMGTPSPRPRRWAVPVGALAVAAVVVTVYALSGLGVSPTPSPSPTPVALETPSAAPSQTLSAPPSGSASPSAAPLLLSLVAISPVTNHLAEEVRDEYSTGRGAALTVAHGSLWANEGDVLTRRSVETGQYIESHDLPAESWKVQFALGSIWIGHPINEPVIERVDPLSFRVTGQIKPSEPLWDGTVGGQSLYLLATESRVIEYDHLLDAQLPSAPVDVDPIGTETEPVYVDFRDGALYFCECRAGREVKFDPASDRIVDVFDGDRFGLGGDAPKEPGTGTLWLLRFAARTITPYPSEAGPPGTTLGLKGSPRQIAFGFASVWVAAEGWVHRISSNGSDVQDIEMPAGAKAVSIAIDEQTSRVWVSLCYGTCPP